MDTSRQDEQLLDNGVPEGAQRLKRETVSRGGANVFQSGAIMLGQTGRTHDKTEGKKRDINEGDEM